MFPIECVLSVVPTLGRRLRTCNQTPGRRRHALTPFHGRADSEASAERERPRERARERRGNGVRRKGARERDRQTDRERDRERENTNNHVCVYRTSTSIILCSVCLPPSLSHLHSPIQTLKCREEGWQLCCNSFLTLTTTLSSNKSWYVFVRKLLFLCLRGAL